MWQGGESIPSRDVGHVLRILGQNPTEDQIVEMVMKVCPSSSSPLVSFPVIQNPTEDQIVEMVMKVCGSSSSHAYCLLSHNSSFPLSHSLLVSLH